MKTLYICLTFCLIYNTCFGWGVPDISKAGKSFFTTGSDLTHSTANIGKSVITKIPDIIPTPIEIFSMGKETLAGLPFKVAFEAINQICSLAVSGNGTTSRYTPTMEEMSFLLMHKNGNSSFPLTNPGGLWLNSEFNPNHNTTIFITGWKTDLSIVPDVSIETVSKAYLARGDINIIVLDSARYVDTLYTWSAFNTELIGEYVGRALALLVKTGYPAKKIHVVGHSLGAQISGAAGRYFALETGESLARITGLDAANPCFNEGEALGGLQRGDADFVDVIHTDNGALGQRQPIGDVDFYPNGVVALQPGCLTISCAHSRAWELWAESVYPQNEQNFLAIRCNSLTALRNKKCPGRVITMGFAVDFKAKGNYFLTTYASLPFGENAQNA